MLGVRQLSVFSVFKRVSASVLRCVSHSYFVNYDRFAHIKGCPCSGRQAKTAPSRESAPKNKVSGWPKKKGEGNRTSKPQTSRAGRAESASTRPRFCSPSPARNPPAHLLSFPAHASALLPPPATRPRVSSPSPARLLSSPRVAKLIYGVKLRGSAETATTGSVT